MAQPYYTRSIKEILEGRKEKKRKLRPIFVKISKKIEEEAKPVITLIQSKSGIKN